MKIELTGLYRNFLFQRRPPHPPLTKEEQGGVIYLTGSVLQEEKGFSLLIIILLMVMMTFLGLSGIMTTNTDVQISANYYGSYRALNLAEAGLQRAMADILWDLWQDQNLSNSNFYQSGSSTPLTIFPASTSFYTVFSGSLGNGTYTVAFKNVGGSPNFSPNEIFVRSTGVTGNGSQKVIESYLATENVNPWNNAIFANKNGGGVPINGNVNVGGSVHILGNGINPCVPSNPGTSNTAVYIQTGNIFNGHTNGGSGNDIDSTLATYINYTGWDKTNLNAKFRVQRGCVDMHNGSGTIGKSANPVKGIYIGNGNDANNDGINDDIIGGINGGSGQNLYSNNRTKAAYDLGNKVTFPSIDVAWLDAHSLNGATSCPATPGGYMEIKNDTLNFLCTNGTNSILWDKASQTLTVNGVIKLDEIRIRTDIKYSGRGTLYCSNSSKEVEIEGNILPVALASYPTVHVLGILAAGDVRFNRSQLRAAGAFYSAKMITPQQQTEVAGTLVCDKFNLGSQVPKIWQVPTLSNNLPPGMPGSLPLWGFTSKRWREVF